MSNQVYCISSNPDISGIGVRTSIYAQNLLSFIPAIFALRDEVTVITLENLETQSTTILITAFAILLSTVVQVFTKGVSDFHATIILNLSWMNNTNLFIYFLLYVYHRAQQPDSTSAKPEAKDEAGDVVRHTLEGEPGRHGHPGRRGLRRWVDEAKMALRKPALIIGSFHLSFMAALGLWLWHHPSDFGNSQPCSESVSIVILGEPILLRSRGLQNWSVFIYSLVLAPVFNLVIPITFFITPLFLRYYTTLYASRQTFSKRYISAGLILLLAINMIFLADTEAMIKKNKALVQKGDTDWTFGQTLALLLLLVPLRDLFEAIWRRRAKSLGKKLLGASEKGQLEVVQNLINLGAGSYYKDLSLVSATQDRHLDVVKYLLEHGANVNAEDQHGSTALQAAISCKDLKTVEYLLGHGANLKKYNVKDQSIIDLLFDAIERCFNTIVKHLLEHGVNAEYALISASYSDNLDAMKLLLDYGADVNFQTKNGDTALRGAVQMGHLNITAYLVEHGADMTLIDSDGKTALQLAKEYRHQAIVEHIQAAEAHA